VPWHNVRTVTQNFLQTQNLTPATVTLNANNVTGALDLGQITKIHLTLPAIASWTYVHFFIDNLALVCPTQVQASVWPDPSHIITLNSSGSVTQNLDGTTYRIDWTDFAANNGWIPGNLVLQIAQLDNQKLTGTVYTRGVSTPLSGDWQSIQIAYPVSPDAIYIRGAAGRKYGFSYSLNGGSSSGIMPNPNADADGDGVTDRDESMAGTNPFDAMSKPRIPTQTILSSTATNLIVQYSYSNVSGFTGTSSALLALPISSLTNSNTVPAVNIHTELASGMTLGKEEGLRNVGPYYEITNGTVSETQFKLPIIANGVSSLDGSVRLQKYDPSVKEWADVAFYGTSWAAFNLKGSGWFRFVQKTASANLLFIGGAQATASFSGTVFPAYLENKLRVNERLPIKLIGPYNSAYGSTLTYHAASAANTLQNISAGSISSWLNDLSASATLPDIVVIYSDLIPTSGTSATVVDQVKTIITTVRSYNAKTKFLIFNNPKTPAGAAILANATLLSATGSLILLSDYVGAADQLSADNVAKEIDTRLSLLMGVEKAYVWSAMHYQPMNMALLAAAKDAIKNAASSTGCTINGNTVSYSSSCSVYSGNNNFPDIRDDINTECSTGGDQPYITSVVTKIKAFLQEARQKGVNTVELNYNGLIPSQLNAVITCQDFIGMWGRAKLDELLLQAVDQINTDIHAVDPANPGLKLSIRIPFQGVGPFTLSRLLDVSGITVANGYTPQLVAQVKSRAVTYYSTLSNNDFYLYNTTNSGTVTTDPKSGNKSIGTTILSTMDSKEASTMNLNSPEVQELLTMITRLTAETVMKTAPNTQLESVSLVTDVASESKVMMTGSDGAYGVMTDLPETGSDRNAVMALGTGQNQFWNIDWVSQGWRDDPQKVSAVRSYLQRRQGIISNSFKEFASVVHSYRNGTTYEIPKAEIFFEQYAYRNVVSGAMDLYELLRNTNIDILGTPFYLLKYQDQEPVASMSASVADMINRVEMGTRFHPMETRTELTWSHFIHEVVKPGSATETVQNCHDGGAPDYLPVSNCATQTLNNVNIDMFWMKQYLERDGNWNAISIRDQIRAAFAYGAGGFSFANTTMYDFTNSRPSSEWDLVFGENNTFDQAYLFQPAGLFSSEVVREMGDYKDAIYMSTNDRVLRDVETYSGYDPINNLWNKIRPALQNNSNKILVFTDAMVKDIGLAALVAYMGGKVAIDIGVVADMDPNISLQIKSILPELLPFSNTDGLKIWNPGTPVDVYLLAGQSNMEGHGAYSDFTNSGDIPPGTFLSMIHAGWISGADAKRDRWLSLGYSNGWAGVPYSFGPEIGFAKYFEERRAQPVFIVKVVHGGTAISASCIQDNPYWAKSTSSLFNTLIEQKDSALADLTKVGLFPQVKGMAWMQGETDALYDLPGCTPEQYGERLKTFLSDMRAGLNLPNLPIAVGMIKTNANIPNSGRASWWTYGETVTEQQRTIVLDPSMTNVSVVGTNETDLSHLGADPSAGLDAGHIDGPSLFRVGWDFAKALEKLNK